MLEARTLLLNAPVVVGVPLNGPWLIDTGLLLIGATAVAETLPAGAAKTERTQESRIAQSTRKGFILDLGMFWPICATKITDSFPHTRPPNLTADAANDFIYDANPIPSPRVAQRVGSVWRFLGIPSFCFRGLPPG